MSDSAKQITLAVILLITPPLIIVLMLLMWPYPGGDGMLMSPLLTMLSGGKGFGTGFNASEDFRILLVVVLSGALGASIYAMQSFASYVGNQTFSGTWFWWYVLRLPIGSLLAMALYFALRGGLLASATTQDSTTLDSINVFGVAALSILAGLFSRQAIDKLADIFAVLFPSKENDQRSDPLEALKGFSIEPTEVKAKTAPPPTITIHGADLSAEHKITLDGKPRPADLAADRATLTLKLEAADLASPGDRKIVVEDGKGRKTEPLILKITPPGPAPLKGFSIAPTDLKAKTSPPPDVVIQGPDLAVGHTVTMDDKVRPATFAPDKKTLTLTLLAEDIAEAGPHRIVVQDGKGGRSEEMVLEVT